MRIGRRITKIQVYNSDANVPFYSSNVFKPFGFLPSSNLDDFDHDYILWGIDGNFDFNIKKKKDVFGTTDHCGAIKILDDCIVPEYLVYQLELKKHELGFDRTLRASLQNMEKVSVNVPCTSDGKIDRATQEETVSQYVLIKKLKARINVQLSELENAKIELTGDDTPVCTKAVLVSKVFDFPPTNSKITKRFCNENNGNIPVYGCSKSDNTVLGHIRDNLNSVKYYQDCLTWNRNGSVGYFFHRQGKFTTNEDHRVLTIKQEYSERLDPNYLKYTLQNTVRKLGYNFSNKLGKERIAKITIQIPVMNNGKFDIRIQRHIAKKCKRAYDIKQSLVENLLALNEVAVSL